MRSGLAGAALAGLLVVLQTTTEGIWGARPDFILLFVLAAGIRRGEIAGALSGGALGFLQDTFSACVPGTHLLTKGLIGYAAGSVRGRMDCANPNTQALVAAAASCAEGVAHIALLKVLSPGALPLLPPLAPLLPSAALNGVLLPASPVLWSAALRRFARRRAAGRTLA